MDEKEINDTWFKTRNLYEIGVTRHFDFRSVPNFSKLFFQKFESCVVLSRVALSVLALLYLVKIRVMAYLVWVRVMVMVTAIEKVRV